MYPPPLTKILYLIQLQSHYTPALALTDNQARISGNVNTSKTRCSKAIPKGGYTIIKRGGWGLRNWVWEGQSDSDK